MFGAFIALALLLSLPLALYQPLIPQDGTTNITANSTSSEDPCAPPPQQDGSDSTPPQDNGSAPPGGGGSNPDQKGGQTPDDSDSPGTTDPKTGKRVVPKNMAKKIQRQVQKKVRRPTITVTVPTPRPPFVRIPKFTENVFQGKKESGEQNIAEEIIGRMQGNRKKSSPTPEVKVRPTSPVKPVISKTATKSKVPNAKEIQENVKARQKNRTSIQSDPCSPGDKQQQQGQQSQRSQQNPNQQGQKQQQQSQQNPNSPGDKQQQQGQSQKSTNATISPKSYPAEQEQSTNATISPKSYPQTNQATIVPLKSGQTAPAPAGIAVDIVQYNAILDCFGIKNKNKSKRCTIADLNKDGNVDQIDIQIIYLRAKTNR